MKFPMRDGVLYSLLPTISVSSPSRAGVGFVFAFRALSERFQSAFGSLPGRGAEISGFGFHEDSLKSPPLIFVFTFLVENQNNWVYTYRLLYLSTSAVPGTWTAVPGRPPSLFFPVRGSGGAKPSQQCTIGYVR